MAVPLQHQTHCRPRLTDAERDDILLGMRAVLYAMAHEFAQDGTAGPDTCLLAVPARVAPMPVEPVADQDG